MKDGTAKVNRLQIDPQALDEKMLSYSVQRSTLGESFGLSVASNRNPRRTKKVTDENIEECEGRILLLAPTHQTSYLKECFCETHVTVLGKDTSRAKLVDSLKQNFNVVVLFTHSDGIDAKLATKVTLCPFRYSDLDLESKSPPYCLSSRYCTRQKIPLKDDSDFEMLVGPESIICRTLVFIACNAVHINSGPVSWEQTLLSSILQRGSCNAIIATPGIITPSIHDLEVVLSAIARSQNAGDLNGNLNRLKSIEASNMRFVLFGNPQEPIDILLEDSPKDSQKRTFHAPHKEPSRLKAHSHIQGLGFIEAYTMGILLESDNKFANEISEVQFLKAKIQSLLLFGSHPDLIYENFGHTLTNHLLKILAKRGASVIYHDWWKLVLEREKCENTVCSNCNGILENTKFHFRSKSIPSRVLSACAACHVVSDSAEAELPKLKYLSGKSFQVNWPFGNTNWDALLRVSCADDTKSLSVRWPARDDGGPVTVHEAPTELPDGPLKVSFAFIRDYQLSVVNIPIRRASR